MEQRGYRVRMEWGPSAVASLGPVCAAVVIVDVLSFSTAVDVAVGRGASVLPLRWAAGQPIDATGAVLAGHRGSGSWSLSPASLLDLPAGTRLALPSPNGATLSAAAQGSGSAVLAGCLRNASAVAAAAAGAASAAGGAIAVVAAGERWPDGALRPAVEDLLGAGAVVAALVASGMTGGCSPEATAAADAFDGARRRGIAAALAGCSSGRELADRGFAADVELAAEYDTSAAVPVLRDGEYRR